MSLRDFQLDVTNSRGALGHFLDAATEIARGEIVVAIREPARKLTVLLRNRSAALSEQAENDRLIEEAALARVDLEADPTWGMF